MFSANSARVLTRVGVVLMMFTLCAPSASASTTTWECDMQVHGIAIGGPTGGGGPTTMVVPVGTPMTIILSFDRADQDSA